MDERPHDILAAEEFSVPAPDPALDAEPVHDVLAAEEFSVPGIDVTLHHGPATVPGSAEGDDGSVHDVLAAEEFAVPAGRRAPQAAVPARDRRRWWLAGALAVGLTAAVRRRR